MNSNSSADAIVKAFQKMISPSSRADPRDLYLCYRLDSKLDCHKAEATIFSVIHAAHRKLPKRRTGDIPTNRLFGNFGLTQDYTTGRIIVRVRGDLEETIITHALDRPQCRLNSLLHALS